MSIFQGQFAPITGPKAPSIRQPKSAIDIATGLNMSNGFDTKLNRGPVGTHEQFKGLPNTGFTPKVVGAGLPGQGGDGQPMIMFQQRLRLMFIQLVEGGMSHKDAAKHIQQQYGVHARTGQKINKKVEFTKAKKMKYAGLYATGKHYHNRSGHHRPRRVLGTPAGLK